MIEPINMIKKMQQLKKRLQRAAGAFHGFHIRTEKYVRRDSPCRFQLATSWQPAKGAAGFTKATQEVSSYQEPVSNLMKAIAAVIVLVGAFNVYFKMQNGDQDVKRPL